MAPKRSARTARPALEPIAIIGMACRFPQADGPAAFWQLLRNGVDAVVEVPPDRWDVETFYSPTPSTPRKMVTRWGGFLEQVDRFDAAFFRISPREAERMDPQQRLLLETAWEALEDAGQVPKQLAGKPVSVFVGLSSNDYGRLQADPNMSDAYMPTGNAGSIAANRISFFFDLQGPSATVDTACSSALVGVHLACSSIWNGESVLGLAGGANVILSPTNAINFSQAGMMSPDGRCKAFDARANGYVRAEGAGMVVLKRLSQAEADGDRIYALIRGTAVNQDGHTSSLTVPSQSAQERVTREACSRAGVSPGQIDYVEAHGTGTPVGDPIEARALGTALALGREPGGVCAIGSCKTNIGHPESAAGIAGVIKVALSLTHREIPASLHFHEPNPLIPFGELPLRVQTERGPWPDKGRPSLAGVNSFGFGGTNAHVVLEQYVGASGRRAETPSIATEALKIFPLSADSPESLKALAQAHVASLESQPGSESDPLQDLCYTASVRRTHHEQRLAAVVHTREELADRLNAFLAGESRLGLYHGRAQIEVPAKLAFVFPGQGSQWWGMGRSLIESDAAFRDAVDECDATFRRHAAWSLMDELRADESRSRLHETEIAQPALFALQVGLAALWRSRGVTPGAVIGHSLGEVAAVHVAGALSLCDAADVVFHRSRLMQQATGKGRMAAVELSQEDAEAALRGFEDRVSIAAANSPSSVVLSGDADPLEAVLQALQSRDVFFRYLPVNYAFHSHQMEPYLKELERELRGLSTHAPSVPVFSTVTGGPIQTHQELGAGYWLKNLRQPVQFSSAVAVLIEQGHRLFLELSPHPTLSGVIGQCLKKQGVEGTFIPSLRRGEEDEAVVLGGIGALHVAGFEIDWQRLYPDGGRCADLPRYAWNRERHWLEPSDITWQSWSSHSQTKKHPLLGRRLESAQPTWRAALSGDRLGYLNDHQVQDSPLLPAAAYLEIGLAAARETLGDSAGMVTDAEFLKPLLLPEDRGVLVETSVTTDSEGSATFRILSRRATADEADSQSWILHASGRIRTPVDSQAHQPPDPALLSTLRARCSQEVSVDDLYRQLAHNGLQYGPCFRGIEKIWRGDAEALAYVSAPLELRPELSNYLVHPAVLDSCFQALAAAVDSGTQQHGLYLPTGISRIRVHGEPGPEVWCHVRLVRRPDQTKDVLEGEIRLLDEAGTVFVEASGLRLQLLDSDARPQALRQQTLDRIYELAWQPKLRPGQNPAHVAPEILPGPRDMHEELGRHLRRLTALKGYDRCDFDKWEHWGNVQVLIALRQLGWEPRIGDRFTTAELEARLGVIAPHSRMFGRLLDRLEEAGVLAPTEDGWVVSAVPGEEVDEDETALFHELLASHPAAQLDLQLQRRSSSHMADVLRGARNAFEVIFPDGSLAAAERFYQDSPFISTFSLLIQRALSMAVDRLPGDATIRVLEIGAGTGGTTAHILPKLPRSGVDYVFSDISPVFTAHGEQKFAGYPFCRYQLLDIEKDPLEQGFSPHSFDVIIASNVLHATIDLRRTLGGIKTLLADRGLLLLGELTGPSALGDLVFAMTEGWWRFQDFDLRPSYPLMSREQWLCLLTGEGFGDATSVPGDVPLRSRQTLLLARGPRVSEAAEASVVSFPDGAGAWLVFGRGDSVDTELVARLRARGERCVRIAPGEGYVRVGVDDYQADPARPEDIREAIGQSLADAPALRGVIYLWGLDGIEQDAAGYSAAVLDRCAGGALHLAQTLASREGTPPRLWFVTRGVAPLGGEPAASAVTQASLWGLARVLTNEHPELRCTTVDLSPQSTGAEIGSLFEELWADDREREIALRGTARYVHRAGRYAARKHNEKRIAPREGSFRLEVSRPGVFDSMVLRETEARVPGDGQVGIQVSASSLNFLDVLSALGLRPDQPARGAVTEIGMECVGKVTAVGSGVTHVRVGDDVIAVAPYSLSNHTVSHSAFVVRKPSGMSDEDAATIPVAFLTAYYALHHLGRIRKGERILIHAAAGGVGLAAVQLARRAGADVYVTAGSPAKREYLRALGLQHVMDSRSLAFAEQVMESTGGTGVDLVLNSLAGDAIPASLSLLRPNGRFLEIGKKDIYQNSQLGLTRLRNNRSFHAIDLIPLFTEQPEFSGEMFREVVSLFEAGELRPLPYTAFPISEAEDAFRYMAQAKQIGKVVVTAEDGPVPVAAAHPAALAFGPDASYLITGGFGGFGLTVAEWMVERGARNLILMGRRGPQSEEALQALKAMEEAGARVAIAKADVSNREDVHGVVCRIQQGMPPLRGIIHTAMVLEDAAVLQLTLPSLHRVMDPKCAGAWNLHEATLGQPLDFFVLFGSMAALVGSPGQANYVAANAALDTFAHYRRARGLPATTIDWGRLGQVGYVARHAAVGERLDGLGIKGMPPRQALDALERVILENPAQVAVVDADWRATTRIIESPLLSALIPEAGGAAATESDHALRAALLAADSGERQTIVETYIQNELSRVLRLDASRIDPAKRLTSLGLDSLMAYELKARIESDLGVGLPMVKLVGGPSISELAAFLVTQVEAMSSPALMTSSTSASTGAAPLQRPVPAEPVDADTVDDPIAGELDDLSDEQVNSLLSDFSAEEKEAAREHRT